MIFQIEKYQEIMAALLSQTLSSNHSNENLFIFSKYS